MPFDVGRFNEERFEDAWAKLNTELQEVEDSEGLASALRALHRQQLNQGFIQDDLLAVVRWRLRNQHRPAAEFIVQFNPRRALRQAGAGRSDPPSGINAVNNRCFLDRDNIRWQQRGIQLGYDLTVQSTSYIALTNPFPLMPTHVTIAKREHEPQSWIGASKKESAERIEAILRDLLSLTGRLPGFVGFYNGVGAGATIPAHFHFHFFERPQGREPFPLEQAAAPSHRLAPVVLRRDKYPITTLYFRGDLASIVRKTTNWVEAWTDVYRNDSALSANIIATLDDDVPGEFHLFFVPRNRHFSHAPGAIGLIGGLEVLGELVFSTDAERQSIETGRFDYQAAAQTLAAVEAPGVEEFLSRVLIGM